MKGETMGINREIDDKMAQKEQKETQEQTAAAIAAGHRQTSLFAAKKKNRLSVKAFAFIALIAIVFFTAVLGGFWLLKGNTPQQQTAVFVEHVQELAALATAKAYMKTVIYEKDNKIFGQDIPIDLPGTRRELLLVVPATVIAGVDLKKVTAEKITINEKAKKIHIVLPHADFLEEPALHMDKIQAVVDDGIFRADVKMKEGFKKAALAQEQLRKEAIAEGLLASAEENAEKVLKEFFKNIGYTAKVTFE